MSGAEPHDPAYDLPEQQEAAIAGLDDAVRVACDAGLTRHQIAGAVTNSLGRYWDDPELGEDAT